MTAQEQIDFGANQLKKSLENIVVYLEGLGAKDQTIFDLAEVQLMIKSGNTVATSLLLRDGVVTVGRQALRDFEKDKWDFYKRAILVLNAYYGYTTGLLQVENDEEEALKLGASLLREIN